MKLAFALGCLMFILGGLFDLEPYRPRRLGRVQRLHRLGPGKKPALR